MLIVLSYFATKIQNILYITKVLGKYYFRVLQNSFHTCFLNPHTHVLVELVCGFIAFPDIQGDVVATDRTGIVADMLVERFAYVLAS